MTISDSGGTGALIVYLTASALATLVATHVSHTAARAKAALCTPRANRPSVVVGKKESFGY